MRRSDILIAEDDDDDFLLTREAIEESRLPFALTRVRDGEELLQFLYREAAYAALKGQSLPDLILLDLNMPKLDGREALREIKADRRLCHIPIVVLTTSQAPEDIFLSYQTGVNSFIRKPDNFDDFVAKLQAFGHYWFGIVELPESST